MLRIRLTRIGKKSQPFYRVVVAEHARAAQGKFIEIVGFYNPLSKKAEIKTDRISHWIGNGAKPSETVAALLKANGMDNMDQYLGARDKKRKKKNPTEEEQAAAEPAAPAEAKGEASTEDAS